VGFRNLNIISKSFYCHRPRSRSPNGSLFEVSCHCLSIQPISRFESRRGLQTPRSVVNLNINVFSLTFHRPTHLTTTRKHPQTKMHDFAWLSRLFLSSYNNDCYWRDDIWLRGQSGLKCIRVNFSRTPWHLHFLPATLWRTSQNTIMIMPCFFKPIACCSANINCKRFKYSYSES
jgi:hypothetical protein